jgi:nitroreductase
VYDLEVFNIIKNRRTIRRYKVGVEVEEDKILRVMEAGRLAPSAGNRQPWSFIIVKDRDVKKKLVDACRGQSFVADASFIVVVLGDPNASRWYKQDPFIAASFMTLEAYEEGLGVCWVGAFDEDRVKEILGIPKELSVIILLTVGVPDESPPQRPRKPLEELFHIDRYGARYTPKR